MKTIIFDHQCFEMQEFGGISKVYCEVIPFLRKNYNCNVSIKYSNNKHLIDSQIANNVKPLRKYNIPFLSKYQFYQNRFIQRIVYNKNRNIYRSIRLLKNQNFDIFEPTFFDAYFLPFLKDKPFVLQVHDMIPELFPQYFPNNNIQIINKKLLCPLATAIHVPSQQTKVDLINILKIKPDKITVVHHGSPTISCLTSSSTYPFPYILYVGARWSYKNFDSFIDECSIVIKQNPELHIVCTGSAFSETEKKLIANKQLSNNIIQIFASEEELQTLYHNAVAFIYPSAYEGFGMPILEAWSCGCPVMLNNASCFPEIGGDAAIYFDINQKGDLADHIISFYKSSSEDRNDLVTKGTDRLTQFSWNKSAIQLKQIYDTLL